MVFFVKYGPHLRQDLLSRQRAHEMQAQRRHVRVHGPHTTHAVPAVESEGDAQRCPTRRLIPQQQDAMPPPPAATGGSLMARYSWAAFGAGVALEARVCMAVSPYAGEMENAAQRLHVRC